ncbi:DUF803-domain-containing protein [Leucogyrophana mollusca]|uniref:DUF803-domain-containing protein n=1 Tax=Leucogyrophana mollusca TaxID=85980 RepID=A0ACB8C0J2_9AGAM|nr:DUF803-domain-containing protein [Leucogyrophana mollusca]
MAYSRFLTTTNGTTIIDDPGMNLPRLTLQTAIGISVAIAGNVLISLALNFQKLAHLRIDRERERIRLEQRLDGDGSSANADSGAGDDLDDSQQQSLLLETQPLASDTSSSPHSRPDYGSTGANARSDDARSRSSVSPSRARRRNKHQRKPSFVSRFIPFSLGSGLKDQNGNRPKSQVAAMPVDVIEEDQITTRNDNANGKKLSTKDLEEDGNESDYLRSKLWWFGFILMNVGETGNFISYAFAPASVVAPLGTFALMANCLFAPLMLKERFRPRDLIGILLAVIGATTVVLSTPSSDGSPPTLTPDALIKALSQRAFVIFSIIYLVSAVILGGLSEGSAGRHIVVVDVGLCAIFGGFTVLATKAISTLLTKEWERMFTEWITYPLLAVLVITGVLQIRYLNRALRRFDSKLVIPTQFVLFTLSAVIGSAVLYGDFRRATFHQMVTFLYGCGATFAGVFVIAWAPVDNGRGGGQTNVEARAEDGAAIGGSAGVGSVRARNRPVLVIPKGARETPILRNKKSSLSLVGFSPSQNLLLVHTPPRDRPDYWERDVESVSTAGSTRGSRGGRG